MIVPATAAAVSRAAALLRGGAVVGMPTETVYGLAADALCEEAVREIFRVKGRPQDNPLICHVAERSEVTRLVTEVPEVAERLMEAFWPGPLTVLLPAKEGVVPAVTRAGLPRVAVRMPAHEVARALIREVGRPLAAPSANRSGHASPVTAQHVEDDIGERIPLILDGGSCTVGVESTVVEVVEGRVKAARLGGVTVEMLEEVLGYVPEMVVGGEKPIAPGQKYAHYGIAGSVYVVEDAAKAAGEAMRRGGKVAAILCDEEVPEGGVPYAVYLLGGRGEATLHAQRIFALLREAERDGMTEVYVSRLAETGLDAAVMERLRKAAGGY